MKRGSKVLFSWCRECEREWRKNNKEYAKNYRQTHHKCNSNYLKEYRKTHKEQIRYQKRRYERIRYGNDPEYKLKKYLRRKIASSINGKMFYKHSVELLGCTIEEFRGYIESLFSPGMTWSNWSSNGWHLDHIIPVSFFNFSSAEDQRRCFHYTNIRPLWAKDNLSKRNKIEEIQMKIL